MFKDWNSVPGCIVGADANGAGGVPTLKCIPVVFENIITAALTFAGIVALC